MYDSDIRRGNNVAWVAGNNGTIATVKKTCSKENILFTRYAFEQKGGLFNQQIMKKGKGQLPTKPSDPHMQGQTEQEWIDKYGGYNKLSGAYFCLVEYKDKGKIVRSIESVPLLVSAKIKNDPSDLEKYLKQALGTEELSVRIREIKFNTLFNHNGFLMHITGRTGDQLVFKPALQMKVNATDYAYIKKIVRFCEREKESKKEFTVSGFDGIEKDRNIELFDFFTKKLSSDIFMVHHAATLKSLSESRNIFVDMSVEMQARTICQILHIFRCNRMLADLTALQGAKNAGTVLMSKKISPNDKTMIINQSPTGLFENSVDLLTV